MRQIKINLLTFIGMILTIPAFAQASDPGLIESFSAMSGTEVAILIIIAVIIGLILLMLVMMLYLLSFLTKVLKKEDESLVNEPSFWEKFKVRYLTGQLKPVEKEHEIMMDHSYDGIVELDNYMPPWLKYTFYLTIIFGVGYFLNYSVLGIGQTQFEEYQEELRIASIEEEQRRSMALATIDETTVVFDATGPGLRAGQTIYENNCAACHARDGGGGVGPNLTDEYWIHGGSISDIFKVVKYGVIQKGMIPWQDQLSPEEMQQVSSFILTLQETTPLNPKAPEGEKYEPAIEEPTDALGGDELGLEPVDESEEEN
ncbi:cbb3-type cytochrome c oxidase N-terminal domain-containing protein [Pararhodonellum marinum]|uniref:cbb3-type cytochrome c oxidase N-terminal domain-containing protein n=1 Tax=Pararhodonellum marinum TaxID=2755358 RepID=UPI0018904BD7|nr:cbb3-type cytochrome c oxidase N-terminal domain-containing protein [Pararhodonellum marinum]